MCSHPVAQPQPKTSFTKKRLRRSRRAKTGVACKRAREEHRFGTNQEQNVFDDQQDQTHPTSNPAFLPATSCQSHNCFHPEERATTIKLSATRDSTDGSSVTGKLSYRISAEELDSLDPSDPEPSYTGPAPVAHTEAALSPPEASDSSQFSPRPPPFSSLNFAPSPPFTATAADLFSNDDYSDNTVRVTEPGLYSLSAFAPAPLVNSPLTPSSLFANLLITPAAVEVKAALPPDIKGEGGSSKKSGVDDGEPPPPYTEGYSPLESFAYVMAAAGGAASIITQVQQGGPPQGGSLADVGADENISLDLRGTRFNLSRDELLTLPEFVLLSLFPNGLLPDNHMGSFHEGDVYPVDYDPASLLYMLDFFRNVAQTIPSAAPSPTEAPNTPHPGSSLDPAANSPRDMLQDRAGIIVLREDLDFYTIPPYADIEQSEMIEVKRAAGRALLSQDGIFSGLRKSEETGTTEQHLIEMLTAGGFNNDDSWGHRAGEPNKAVICSLALARLRTDIKGNDLANSNAVGMAQKLLLFWRKPARRCWWEGIELENVEGMSGKKLKVWIRRVWTLEMSVIGLR
ncbi:hypothetical protein MMC25_001740 [Agyrium rufum]|nr:hypothetical protein [Agyrium rufum]